jgi:hypothetical protein
MKSALGRKLVAAAIVLIAMLGGLWWQQSDLRYLLYGARAESNKMHPWAVGTNGMVAATTGGTATQAGLEILKEGGTAADAAMATALTEVVQAGGASQFCRHHGDGGTGRPAGSLFPYPSSQAGRQ